MPFLGKMDCAICYDRPKTIFLLMFLLFSALSMFQFTTTLLLRKRPERERSSGTGKLVVNSTRFTACYVRGYHEKTLGCLESPISFKLQVVDFTFSAMNDLNRVGFFLEVVKKTPNTCLAYCCVVEANLHFTKNKIHMLYYFSRVLFIPFSSLKRNTYRRIFHILDCSSF